MAEATLKRVAQMAGVAPVTVSRVVHGAESVAPATRERVLAVIRELNYKPNIHAARLRQKGWSDRKARAATDRVGRASGALSGGCRSCVEIPHAEQEAMIFGSDEGRELGRQLTRLRRDLDRLSQHAERIRSCVDILQEACSRRASSSAAH